ncbi:MAG TPA: LysR family transcriptional regulator [Chthoniobacterales bacterium]|jgi:DNA-binding transcriptional LysR family regulator
MSQLIDSKQLRAFASLAKTGSFTQTARELEVTQSAISHAIKALEEDLHCRLLDRVGKTVVLNQAGEQFLARAEKILKEMAEARSDLGKLGKWGTSRLRIGASTTACQYIIPTVLREFKESFPHCSITIQVGDTPENIEALRMHQIDLAVNLEPRRNELLEFRELFMDELKFLVSPMHPWALSGKADRSQIAVQNYIFYSKKSYTFEIIEWFFREEGISLHSLLELGNMEAIKELVKLGLGISVLAPWTATKELAEQSLIAVPLGKRKLKRRWGILHGRERRLSLAEETFIGLCETVCQSFEEI